METGIQTIDHLPHKITIHCHCGSHSHPLTALQNARTLGFVREIPSIAQAFTKNAKFPGKNYENVLAAAQNGVSRCAVSVPLNLPAMSTTDSNSFKDVARQDSALSPLSPGMRIGGDIPENSITQKKSLRILIVDDNVDAAETMAMLQQYRGHETYVAHTGLEAIAIASRFLPEVVLLDIGLPEMDGHEVARRLRILPEMEHVFLVALTGYASEADRRRAKEAGFDEHLSKPADLNLLREWLNSVSLRKPNI